MSTYTENFLIIINFDKFDSKVMMLHFANMKVLLFPWLPLHEDWLSEEQKKF